VFIYMLGKKIKAVFGCFKTHLNVSPQFCPNLRLIKASELFLYTYVGLDFLPHTESKQSETLR